MVKVGIMGGAGYTGGELVRLLLNHAQAELVFVHSRSQAGKRLSSVHLDLLGETDLKFSSGFEPSVDVLFLCMGHGESSRFLAENKIPTQVKIIDLSQDYRWQKDSVLSFVYGLPEAFKEDIAQAQNIANPGCFATAIQLALLPLGAEQLLMDNLQVTGITGSTGAGQSPSSSTHFSWRDSNISVYKPFEHQHLYEIKETLRYFQPSWDKQLNFIPIRGNFSRGILVSAYTQTDLDLKQIQQLYAAFYAAHPFVNLSPENPDLKQVINTNKCLLHLEKHGDTLLIISVLDNLLKGASGQALQNMNLMFGLAEDTALKLKPVVF